MAKQTERATEARGHRSRRMTAMLLGCTAIALPSLVAAQEGFTAETEEVFRLSPITISPGGQADDDMNNIVAQELWVGGKVATSILDTPASVAVITQKEIEQRDAKTTEQVLQYTPGISTDYWGTDDRNDYFLVRGFQASTYRDGMTLGTMRSVREEPYAFERVEVLKGANSTLFGPSDPGGSINFVTKTPIFERFGNAYAQYGSWDHAEVGFDFGDVANESGTLAYRLTGKIQNADLEYDYSKNDEEFLMGGLTWAPTDDTEVTFVLDWLKRDGTPNSGGYPFSQMFDRSSFFGEPDFNYQNVERTTATLLVEHQFMDGLFLRANLRYSDLKDDFGYAYLNALRPVGSYYPRDVFGADNTADELNANVILQYDTEFGSVGSSTLFGAEYRNASTSNTSFYAPGALVGVGPINVNDPVFSGPPDVAIPPYSDQTGDYETTSLFIQQNFSFDDRVIATIGARQDWMDLSATQNVTGTAVETSDDPAETSWRAALTYKITDGISTYASYVQSVAPPVIGVDPERGEQYEIGVKYEPEAINALVTASIFDLTRENVTVAVVMPNGAIERQVVGEQRSRGFELEGKAQISDNFDLIAGYSYLDTDIVEGGQLGAVNGNQFASVPNNMASLWGYYTIPGAEGFGDISIGLGARYTGEYYFNNTNNNGKSSAATIFDAAFAYELAENAQITLNVSNLFDEQHVVGRGTADYYNPGRMVLAGVNYSW